MFTVAGDNQQPSNEFYLNSTSMPWSNQGKEIPWTMLTRPYLSIASISTPQIKTKKVSSMSKEDATPALQNCFKCMMVVQRCCYPGEPYQSWGIYIFSRCVDDVVNTKTVKWFPNQKAWMDWEVRALCIAKKAAYWSGDDKKPKQDWNLLLRREGSNCKEP